MNLSLLLDWYLGPHFSSLIYLLTIIKISFFIDLKHMKKKHMKTDLSEVILNRAIVYAQRQS